MRIFRLCPANVSIARDTAKWQASFYDKPTISGAIVRKTGPGFSAGRPKVVFEGTSRYSPYLGVAADGKRFLMIKRPPETQGPADQVTVVLN